jgi:hypothetical protein
MLGFRIKINKNLSIQSKVRSNLKVVKIKMYLDGKTGKLKWDRFLFSAFRNSFL